MAPPAGEVIARVFPEAVEHNLQWVRKRIGGLRAPPRIWAVVKADAYGHGLSRILPGLASADGLAVRDLDEAYRCRKLGWRKPILAMNARFGPDDLDNPALYPLHLIADDASQLDMLARRRALNPFVWLRYAGRLNHAGFDQASYIKAYYRARALCQSGHAAGVGHLQHYAQAEADPHRGQERLSFRRLTDPLPGPRCSENSAALVQDPMAGQDDGWVRTGILVYGISPIAGRTGAELGLRAAMTLQAPLNRIRTVARGEAIGYGAQFVAARDTRIGLVNCGYADGYPRLLSECATVLVNGRPHPVVGRVSMDIMAVDLGNAHADLRPGTMVTLWGEGCPIEHVAQHAGTIPAQLCVGLGARVRRFS